MATDAQILTAARAVADAVVFVKAAKDGVATAASALEAAQRREKDAIDRFTKAEASLTSLARQKPAEPPPRVEAVEPVADWATHRVTWVRTVPGLSGQIREAAEKQYGGDVLVGMKTHPEYARICGCETVRVWVPVSRIKFREFI